jgi:hypothetical protein
MPPNAGAFPDTISRSSKIKKTMTLKARQRPWQSAQSVALVPAVAFSVDFLSRLW